MAEFTGSVYSEALGMHTSLRVVTPKYRRAEGTFRVVYLLHGISDNSSDWLMKTRVTLLADDYQVMLVVPEVQRSFYADMKYGMAYFTYVAKELPGLVESLFQASPKREDRFVMGISMGGYGALKCALSCPETYAGCAALSPASDIRAVTAMCATKQSIMSKSEAQGILGPDFDNPAPGTDPLLEHDLFALARRQDKNPCKSRFFITCGTEDFLHQMNVDFKNIMAPLHYDFTYLEWPGIHEWYFWDESVHLAFEHFFGKGSDWSPYSLARRKGE